MEQSVVRALLTAIILISAVIVGIVGVWLAKHGGMSLPNAILAGAGGFGITIPILLALAQFLMGMPS
ncbi:hypothetical protein GCM10022252_64890 [Streptosporangium oxazolinicum]|uniref:Uncharacterized protein n=1 Tax=Streptosporangium oxazolinicum TaxID=909287 RepID=A0ABP8BEH9_9ACTN